MAVMLGAIETTNAKNEKTKTNTAVMARWERVTPGNTELLDVIDDIHSLLYFREEGIIKPWPGSSKKKAGDEDGTTWIRGRRQLEAGSGRDDWSRAAQSVPVLESASGLSVQRRERAPQAKSLNPRDPPERELQSSSHSNMMTRAREEERNSLAPRNIRNSPPSMSTFRKSTGPTPLAAANSSRVVSGATAVVHRRRQANQPTPTKPNRIIAQVEGSGTAAAVMLPPSIKYSVSFPDD
jgi:hypothetical protein